MPHSRLKRLTFRTLILFVPAIALLLLLAPKGTEPGTAGYSSQTFTENDATAHLLRRIERGELDLDYDEDRGYLSALLKQFDIPVSSQTLVFSKSSFQLDLISPAMPRAIYFNDDVYVGYVQGGRVVEIASVDPRLGPLFYTLSQEKGGQPQFVRQAAECLVCHDSSSDRTMTVPRLIVLSVLPNPAGNAIKAAALLTTDRSQFRERWGGWYVSGTHRDGHLGNTIVRTPASAISGISDYIATMDLTPGANVTDLGKYFDTSHYLTPHSDIVALLVLAHQTHVHNLITLASYEVLKAQKQERETEDAGNMAAVIEDAAEPLVRSMLFSGAAVLPGPIAGTTSFATDFVKNAKRDSRGRSLRDLDLDKRLLRYPLSYLIYSASFDSMPDSIKAYVYRRLHEVLNGQDTSAQFSHLSIADREAVRNILLETKPEFAASNRE